MSIALLWTKLHPKPAKNGQGCAERGRGCGDSFENTKQCNSLAALFFLSSANRQEYGTFHKLGVNGFGVFVKGNTSSTGLYFDSFGCSVGAETQIRHETSSLKYLHTTILYLKLVVNSVLHYMHPKCDLRLIIHIFSLFHIFLSETLAHVQ